VRIHQILSTSLVLVVLAGTAGGANAQRTQTSCILRSGKVRDLVLEDSTFGISFPVEMSSRGDTVLMLGTSGIFDSAGKRVYRRGLDSAIVGFLFTNRTPTASPVPAPAGKPTARYFRVRPDRQGWEAVFFVPDRDTIPGLPYYDDGTFWYGHLRAGRWSDVQQIGRVHKTVVVRPNSAGLTQTGPPSFAVFFGEPNGEGGVIVWQRRAVDARWEADTVALRFAPLTVSATANTARPQSIRFFPIAMIWGEERSYVGSLLSLSATAPAAPKVLRLGGDESMNDPVIFAARDTLHVSWWELDQRRRPNLWYQAIDPEREHALAARRLVAKGVNDFINLEIRDGARTRLVWAYPAPDERDSVEVAVMANGEPVVIGRVAFPFGFMTSGVASGERSFILATSPRPVPDGEPSASRTLEVRVNCTEGT
jgi:hypothetical protein